MNDSKHIQITGYTGKSMRFLLYFAIVFFLANTAFLIYSLIYGEVKPSIIINFMLSVLYIFMYFSQGKMAKLNFVEFGEDRFILQKATAFKQTKDEILYSEIQSIEKQLHKIEITLKGKPAYIVDIQNYPYASLTLIKQEFSELAKRLGF